MKHPIPPTDSRLALLSRRIAAMAFVLIAGCAPALAASEEPSTPGALEAIRPDGERVELVLRHTSVSVEISAFVAQTTVEQVFVNPFDLPVEALYTFPLGDGAAVDAFEMQVGDRVIRGEVRLREEARQVYETARAEGRQAALLEQERPNIFSQSVSNLMPGHEIRVRLRTVELVEYAKGIYQFTFPLVVGQRYFPEHHDGGPSDGIEHEAEDDRVNPPRLARGERSGHDVSIRVALNAGVPIRSLTCPTHRIRTEWGDTERITAELEDDAVIPNKDFVLRWNVSSEQPSVGLLTHRSGPDGFFALLVQPKGVVETHEATPKEIILVLDTSGSMSGLPLEMSRRFAHRVLDSLGDRDTFNVVCFAGGAKVFSPVSLDSSETSLRRARKWLRQLNGNGGTEMLQGLSKAVAQPADPDRLRMIVFLTDGYIGNEFEIIGAVDRISGGARVFTVGIGGSVNHYLLDRMAQVGDGAYTFIPEDHDADKALGRLHDWITRPYLTDLEVDWGALPVVDPLPESPRDLFSGETLTVLGRYLAAAEGTVTVRGRLGGSYWEQELAVVLPEREPAEAALPSAWARRRIEQLLLPGENQVANKAREEVIRLALDYQLMSPYTSFVAVDHLIVADREGPPEPFRQPVPLPEGVPPEACSDSAIVERVMVTARVSLVSLEQTSTLTVSRNEFIQDLPVPGRFYQTVTAMAPGCADPGGQARTLHGSRARDFKAEVAGVSSFDPLGAAPHRAVNPSSIEEVRLITAGAGVEFSRAQGGFARIIQKQGSNAFEGTFDLQVRSGDLDQARKDEAAQTADLDGRGTGFLISGPAIKDRLWYRLAHEWTDFAEPLDTTTTIATIPTRGVSHSDQLTWQVSPRNKLAFRFEAGSLDVGNPLVSALTPVASATDISRDDRSYSLTWTAPQSPRAIIESTVAWEDTSYQERPADPAALNDCALDAADPLRRAHCLDLSSQLESGPAYRSVSDWNRRLTLDSRATIYAGRAGGASHQLRVGLSIEDDRLDHDVQRDPRLLRGTSEADGGELFVGRFPVPVETPRSSSSTRIGLFFEDQLKPVENLALTLGARWDHERIEFDSLTASAWVDPTGSWTGGTIAAVEDVSIASGRLSPSFSLSWDPWGNAETSLFITARRHHDSLFPVVPLFSLEPLTTDLRLELIDGSLSPDPSAQTVVNMRGVSPDLVSPRRNEWTTGFEWEIAIEMKLRLAYIHRALSRQLQVVDESPSSADEPTESGPLPGEFLELAATGSAVHETYLLELIRRQYRSWEMQASYAYSTLRGSGDSLNLLLIEDGPLTDGREAYLAGDRRHEFKVYATTITPWGFRLGGSLTWLSGLPYSTLEQQIGTISPDGDEIGWPRQRYVDGTRNDSRNRSAWNIDIKVTKEMNAGRRLNLRLWLEAYNLLDDRTYRVYNSGIGVGRTINGINDANRRFGRKFQMGIQLNF